MSSKTKANEKMTEQIMAFAPITLLEMNSVKLMNRTDTKFVTNRQKIRFRTYCVSGLQFMEVKTKNNHYIGIGYKFKF